VRQHSRDRFFDDAFGVLLHQRFGVGALEVARLLRGAIVNLLLQLVAGEDRFLGVDDNDEIADISRRRELPLPLLK